MAPTLLTDFLLARYYLSCYVQMSAEDVAISRLFWMLRDRAAPLCSRLRRRRRWAFPRPCAPQAILVSFKCFVLCWRGVHNCVSIRLIKLSLFCTECLDLHRYLRRFRWVWLFRQRCQIDVYQTIFFAATLLSFMGRGLATFKCHCPRPKWEYANVPKKTEKQNCH